MPFANNSQTPHNIYNKAVASSKRLKYIFKMPFSCSNMANVDMPLQ